MINVNPQGNIYLCKTPLESDMRNQLTFSSRQAQQTYFMSTVVRTMDNSTYIRKDGGIKVDMGIEEIRQCNYLFYTNNGFSNRTYYCYITGLTYLSENSTLISIETDCWQTWGFDLVYNQCWIEREHVNNDAIGANTIPETLELGELTVNSITTANFAPNTGTLGDWMICFQVQSLPRLNMTGHNFGGMFNGLDIIGVYTKTQAREVIEIYDRSGVGSHIESIFMAPAKFFSNGEHGDIEYVDASDPSHTLTQRVYFPNDWGDQPTPSDTGTTDVLSTTDINRPTTLNGYTPKNNKLFTYPFSYISITNNTGGDAIFRWEDFSNKSKATFQALGMIGQGCSIKLIPTNYKGMTSAKGNSYYGVTAPKLPICSWSSDYYLNWMAQNTANLSYGATQVGLSGATTAISALLNPFGAINNLAKTADGALELMKQKETAKLQPDQSRGNTNNSDFNFALQKSSFTCLTMSVRAEFAKIIDDYFTAYGYKVSKLKQLSVEGRRYWNYVQTLDCNVDGDIPQDDLETIRNMFNQGCTFWHDPAHMYDYSLNNTIV